MPQVKILDVREIPSGDPERVGLLDMLVTYQLDAFRTYVTTIPKEEFTEDKLREKIRAELAEKEAWVGKEITV